MYVKDIKWLAYRTHFIKSLKQLYAMQNGCAIGRGKSYQLCPGVGIERKGDGSVNFLRGGTTWVEF